MSAMPIGTIIVAVAVFEIHSETNAVAARKPSEQPRAARVPIARMMASAMRRCRSHCCMAAAMHMPPMKRKM